MQEELEKVPSGGEILREEEQEKVDKSKNSHVVFSALCLLLIVFSVASCMALLIVNKSEIAAATGLTTFMILIAAGISLISVVAVFMSWRKITWFLHMYEFACLIALVIFTLVLIGIAMMDSNSNQTSISLLNDCNSPDNYFQFEMLDKATNAANLFCTTSCPCPQYKQVQLCPGWQPTPYDAIMEEMEKRFTCSGWCTVNSNQNVKFMFSGMNETIQAVGPCYNQWTGWVKSQWRSIIGCVAAIMVILFMNILSANWRILKICNRDE